MSSYKVKAPNPNVEKMYINKASVYEGVTGYFSEVLNQETGEETLVLLPLSELTEIVNSEDLQNLKNILPYVVCRHISYPPSKDENQSFYTNRMLASEKGSGMKKRGLSTSGQDAVKLPSPSEIREHQVNLCVNHLILKIKGIFYQDSELSIEDKNTLKLALLQNEHLLTLIMNFASSDTIFISEKKMDS